MTTFLLGLLVLELAAVAALLLTFKETLVSQTQDLRDAIAEAQRGLSAAVTRVADKIASLGEPDPDLSADIQAIRDVAAVLDGLAAETPEPDPDPTEPTPT